ncbi:hypothetical protein LTR17_012678 [Elasticomyces elasticus]|nr:hypothetical protein LTR17_012678 [Elasticomyces elasticus]
MSLELDDPKLEEEENVLVAFALLEKPLEADELASLELDNAELDEDVVLATAEDGVMYGDDELPGIVVTGAECVCTIAVPFSVQVVLFHQLAPSIHSIDIPVQRTQMWCKASHPS